MFPHVNTPSFVPVSTTAFLLGDATTTQSFLNDDAVDTKSFTIVVAVASAIDSGAIKKSTRYYLYLQTYQNLLIVICS